MPKLKHIRNPKRLQNKIVVTLAALTRTVLSKAMATWSHYEDLNIAVKWECTVRIYKTKDLNQLN
jgi:DNA polymerase-3 subunit epsilon